MTKVKENERVKNESNAKCKVQEYGSGAQKSVVFELGKSKAKYQKSDSITLLTNLLEIEAI